MFHVKPIQWWTTYHRLNRQVERQGYHPSALQVRKAALLLQLANQHRYFLPAETDDARFAHEGYMNDAIAFLEGLLDYGQDAFEAELADRKAEAQLGT